MRLSKMRKDLLTEMMKDAIFEAVLSVLQEHGVNGLTMDRIAATANSAKGSLYNYFQSKNDVIRFVYVRIVEPISQVIEQIAQTELPPPEKLEQILHAMFEPFLKYGSVFGMLMKDETIQDIVASAKHKGRAHALEHFTAIFQQGIEDGTFRIHDPVSAGRMFLGCVTELFDILAAGGQSEPVREYIDAVMGILLNGLSVDVNVACAAVEEGHASAVLT